MRMKKSDRKQSQTVDDIKSNLKSFILDINVEKKLIRHATNLELKDDYSKLAASTFFDRWRCDYLCEIGQTAKIFSNYWNQM